MTTYRCPYCGSLREVGHLCPVCTQIAELKRLGRHAEKLERERSENDQRLQEQAAREQEARMREQLWEQERIQREADERARDAMREHEETLRRLQSEQEELADMREEAHADALRELQAQREDFEERRLEQYRTITANADRLQAEEKVRRGSLLEQSHLYEEALQIYKQAQALDPSCYLSYHRMAVVLARLERHEPAKECTFKSLNLLGLSEFSGDLPVFLDLVDIVGRYSDDKTLRQALRRLLSGGIKLQEKFGTLILAARLCDLGLLEEAIIVERHCCEPTLVCEALHLKIADKQDEDFALAYDLLAAIPISGCGEIQSQLLDLVKFSPVLGITEPIMRLCKNLVASRCRELFAEFLRFFHNMPTLEDDEGKRRYQTLLSIAMTEGVLEAAEIERFLQAVAARFVDLLLKAAKECSLERASLARYQRLIELCGVYQVQPSGVTSFREAIKARVLELLLGYAEGFKLDDEHNRQRKELLKLADDFGLSATDQEKFRETICEKCSGLLLQFAQECSFQAVDAFRAAYGHLVTIAADCGVSDAGMADWQTALGDRCWVWIRMGKASRHEAAKAKAKDELRRDERPEKRGCLISGLAFLVGLFICVFSIPNSGDEPFRALFWLGTAVVIAIALGVLDAMLTRSRMVEDLANNLEAKELRKVEQSWSFLIHR